MADVFVCHRARTGDSVVDRRSQAGVLSPLLNIPEPGWEPFRKWHCRLPAKVREVGERRRGGHGRFPTLAVAGAPGCGRNEFGRGRTA
jgi:hypothetical protein